MKWEYYRHLFFDFEWMVDNTVEPFLKLMGEDGWELICINQIENQIWMTFKRPKGEV